MADMPSNVSDLIDSVRKYGLESLGIYYGNYRGTIISHDDPENLGRVKVSVPQLTSDAKSDFWAWPKGQPAGDDFGDFFTPPKDSPVWVEFENGNPEHPIWSGGHWAKTKKVPSEAKGKPKNRVRKSEKWIMEMDDDGGKFRISPKGASHYFELDTAGNLKIQGLSQDNKFSTSAKVEGATAEVKGTLTSSLLSGSTGIAVTPAGITFTAGGVTSTFDGTNFTITAANINLNGVLKINGDPYLSHTHPDADGGFTGGVV